LGTFLGLVPLSATIGGPRVTVVMRSGTILSRSSQGLSPRSPLNLLVGLITFLALFLSLALPSSTPAQEPPPAQDAQSNLPETPAPNSPDGLRAPGNLSRGSITGVVVDSSGSFVVGARVNLALDERAIRDESVSGADGHYFFTNLPPGTFRITVALAGFTSQTSSGALQPGETYTVPTMVLNVASASTEVNVSFTRTELAEAELKDEEKQRVLGFVPNFYVTYNPAALSLTPKQKFELAWKSTIDPVSFGITGGIAGIEQATDAFSGYGQGAQGFGKRYGASYADLVASTFIGGAVLPSILKQDPRYFYKGTGGTRSRLAYALANAVICKGDNGRWQANYSAIIGSLAAGAISNLYYPPNNRYDASLTFENAAIGIGATAVSNILQEFVIRKLTRNAPTYAPAQP
jgi:hypothetical protein